MSWELVVASALGLMDNKLKTDERAQAQRYASYMSNTAHRRQMDDMRKAGLNPILSGKYGGASTPNVSQANVGIRGPEFMQQMSSARQAIAQTENIKAITNQVTKNLNIPFKNYVLHTAANKAVEAISPHLGGMSKTAQGDVISGMAIPSVKITEKSLDNLAKNVMRGAPEYDGTQESLLKRLKWMTKEGYKKVEEYMTK